MRQTARDSMYVSDYDTADDDGDGDIQYGVIHPCAAWPSRIASGESLAGYLTFSGALFFVQTLWITIGLFWDSSVFEGNVWFGVGVPFYVWTLESARYALAHYGNAMATINEIRRVSFERRGRMIQTIKSSGEINGAAKIQQVESMFNTRIVQLTAAQTRHAVLALLQFTSIAALFAACLVLQFVLSNHHISLNYISIPILCLSALALIYACFYFRVARYFSQCCFSTCSCGRSADSVEMV